MADKISTFFLCLSVTAVLSQDVTLNGDCSQNGILTRELMEVWGVQRAPLTCHVWGNASCSNVSLPPTVGGAAVGGPKIVRVEGVLLEDSDLWYPRLVVTWDPPKQATDFENLKGFYMEIHKIADEYPPDFLCWVFDFSESNFTSEDYKLHFQKTFVRFPPGFPPGPYHLYRLDLYSMPKSTHTVAKKQFFTLQGPLKTGITFNWTAAISYYLVNATDPAQITVHFSLAPVSLGFRSYYVQLVDAEDEDNALITCDFQVDKEYQCVDSSWTKIPGSHAKPPDNATTVSHTFNNVPAGNYTLWIQPTDPYRQTDNCLCYNGFTNTDGQIKRRCRLCVTTQTGNFVVDKARPEKPTSAPSTPGKKIPQDYHSTSRDTSTSETEYLPPEQVSSPDTGENTMVTVVAAVLGVVLGLFLVGVVVVVILRRQRTGGFIPIFKQQQHDKDLTPSTMNKKTVYLLYANDHSEHLSVVAMFASFLTVRCNCTVYFLPWFQAEIRTMVAAQWVITRIDQADFVVIINSEAAFNLFDARNTNTSFRIKDEGPEGDTFSIAMTHVRTKSRQSDFYKKTILIYFDYTNEEFIMKELNPGGIYYKLPKHLKELMYHIHEVDTYRMDPKELEVAPMDDLDTPEGRSLQEAITNATNLQKTNKNWFTDRYKRLESTADDNVIIDSVSLNPENFTGPPPYSRYYDDDLESAVTYDTNYINNHERRHFPIPPSDVASNTTEGINNLIYQITLNSLENPPYIYQAPVTSSSLDEEFYPPSNKSVEGDINEQFRNINMICCDNDAEDREYSRNGVHQTQAVSYLMYSPVVSDEGESEHLENDRDVYSRLTTCELNEIRKPIRNALTDAA